MVKTFFATKNEEFMFNHVRIKKEDPDKYFFHTHDVAELLYIVEANGSHIEEGKEYPLKSGDLIVVPPATYHKINLYDISDYERYDICFDHTVLDNIDVNKIFNDIKVINCTRNGIIRDIFKKADYYANCFDAERFIEISNMLIKEIFYNLSIYDGESEEVNFLSPVLSKAINFINKNLFDIKSVSDVSDAVYITEGYLYEIFKNQLKISPKKYITSKRLHHARREICMGARPTDIYLKYGFNDYTSFYRSFVNFFGHNPSETANYVFSNEIF